MKFFQFLGRRLRGAAFFASSILALSVSAADTSSSEAPISGLVKKFTEKHAAQSTPPPASQTVAQALTKPAPEASSQSLSQPGARPIAQPVTTPTRIDASTTKKDVTRKPSPELASLPAPKAASGPLRILLVDDDWSANNNPASGARPSASDEIFRGLVAAAVGGDASAWSVEIAPTYKHGPAFERLRDFNVVVWYTGGSYGGRDDNVAVLSVEDEKTVRRYLQEAGGSFILVSPGYVSNLAYGATWTSSARPFLKEVAGIDGFAALVQRFAAGTVQSPDGARFNVEQKGAAETQFSAVNSDGAAIVFTSSLNPAKTAKEPVPVAVAHPFAGGRFVYVGFTLENIAEGERAQAFNLLLTAAIGSKGAATTTTTGPAVPAGPTPLAKLPNTSPAPSGEFTVQVRGTAAETTLSWTVPSVTLSLNEQVARRSSTTPAAPASGPTVKVERQIPRVYSPGHYWEPMIIPDGASEVKDSEFRPGTTRKYRVTLTEANGAMQTKEVEHTAPLPKDPESITATLRGDYSVLLTWPEVPGVTKYRVQHGFGSEVLKPSIVDGATRWQSPPMDGFKRQWSVTSVYERDGEYISVTEPSKWPRALVQGIDQYFVVGGTFTIHTGNDNKELPSQFTIRLYINGGNTEPHDPANPNPLKLQDIGYSFGSRTTELKVNSSTNFELSTGVDTHWSPQKNNLANIQQHGLRIVITYEPNFPLDAWKIDRLTLTLKFKDRDQISGQHSELVRRPPYPPMADKTITFMNVRTLLTAANPRLDLVTDRFLMPVSP